MTTRIAANDAVRRVARIGWCWLRLRSSRTTDGGPGEPLPVHRIAGRAANRVAIVFGPDGPATLVDIKIVTAKAADDSGAAVVALPG
jgi:hypothetical protein